MQLFQPREIGLHGLDGALVFVDSNAGIVDFQNFRGEEPGPRAEISGAGRFPQALGE